MQICGFQKTTLLDFPGAVASTIFLGGCNFRCPFCHNGDLVVSSRVMPRITEEEVLSHLRKRKEILDGVCITGGEPAIQTEMEPFLKRIKEMGLKVKLDTNGYLPEVLKNLCEKNLIDYVAMDLKGKPGQYAKIAGVSLLDINKIQESAAFLMNGTIPYEFRTTVVKELHQDKDIQEIGSWIAGARAYYLQNFQESEQVIQSGFHGYNPAELKKICRAVQQKIPAAQVRGVE